MTDLNAAGTVVASYAQGSGIDEPLASLTAAGTAFFEADGLGSVTSLSGMGGITDTYTYNAFGMTTATGSNPNRFRYTGREWDSDSGLYYYRARYYDPATGRFLSEDAESFAGGIIFYLYVQNAPTDFSDPFGLYRRKPGVPALSPRLDAFMLCMDRCTGQDQVVTETSGGRHADPGHAAGTTVDIRPLGAGDTVFCCAGKCGAPYLLDERELKTKYGRGAHYHIQLVAPRHPSPRAPNSIPSSCRNDGCTGSNAVKPQRASGWFDRLLRTVF